MSMRSTETTVTFSRPFTLPEFERPRPPGTYRLIADDEEISGLSFLAFRRIGIKLRLPSLATPGGSEQMIAINAKELAAALTADGENR